MRAIAPRLGDLPGVEEIMVAEDQHEFVPIAVAVVTYADGDRGFIARWTFSPEERARIAAGEDVYLSLMSRQVTPHCLMLRPEWAAPLEEKK